MQRAAIIYNPVARGLARHPHSLQRTIGLLANRGIKAKLVPTHGPGTAADQARSEIEAGCDLIIAAGGDGTINEVANGMLHTRVPLAILPGGTANVLAREMRMPIDLERAASQISHMRPVRIDVGALRIGKADRCLFLCMAGAGLDAEIISRLNLDLKAATGKFAYYACAFSQVLRPLREFQVIVDGKEYEASFALISRVRNYGGDLEIARGASLLRNDFEVVLFRGTLGAKYLPYFVGVTLRRLHRMNGCMVLHGRSVACRPPVDEHIYAQVDGELAGHLPISAEIVQDALTLLMPSRFLSREQAHTAVPACA